MQFCIQIARQIFRPIFIPVPVSPGTRYAVPAYYVLTIISSHFNSFSDVFVYRQRLTIQSPFTEGRRCEILSVAIANAKLRCSSNSVSVTEKTFVSRAPFYPIYRLFAFARAGAEWSWRVYLDKISRDGPIDPILPLVISIFLVDARASSDRQTVQETA